MKQKSVLIIGGGFTQIPQIKWAKELGMFVVVTDKNPNAIGKRFADKFVSIDGTDINKLVKLSQSLTKDFKLVGAYCSNDFGLKAISTLSELFSFPASSTKVTIAAINKSESKTIWEDKKLPTPHGKTVTSYKQLLSESKKFGLPIILKPINSCGSQGVRTVQTKSELKTAFTEATRISDSLLIEEIINGQHIDVNGLFLNKKFIKCGIFQRYFSDPPFHYPIWGHQPSLLSSSQEKRVYQLVEKAAKSLGIEVGPVKADVVYTNNGPFIIELAPRFHGDVSTSFITPLSTDGSPIKAWFSYLTGEENPTRYIQTVKCYGGWMALFPTIIGKLKSVEGVDKAKKVAGVLDVFISFKKGKMISTHKDNTSLCGFIWAKASSVHRLYKSMIKAHDLIRFKTTS